MRRFHDMPFGTKRLPNQNYVFQLWAPGAHSSKVSPELWIDAKNGYAPSHVTENGWYSYVVPDVLPGTSYMYRLPNGLTVPDPASRCQVKDVHGPSQIIDPTTFDWTDTSWRGRPWEETILYELHVGTFSPEGTFNGVKDRLDYLSELGITAIELMPIADFPGDRNWGYDGVLPFSPDRRYGTPDDLKELVQTAHHHGIMVFLDVVYNHFGPEGNYLHVYATPFFTDRYPTPWGEAINMDGEQSRIVRDFFIHNALYWLEEYHLDGLRLDAVQTIRDMSTPHFVEELAEAVQRGPGEERHIHLILENEENTAHWLQRATDKKPRWYAAQWNDDLHHAMHVLATQETDGYYVDYADDPTAALIRCLTQGFAYQGEPSPYRQHQPRGQNSAHLPPTAFITFLQNHDQVGNRALGERIPTLSDIPTLRALSSIYLLAPSIPMLFMGEEWGCTQPFPFFCNFGPDLATLVSEGRRREYAAFPQFSDPVQQQCIPDPNALETYQRAILDWNQLEAKSAQTWLAWYRHLLSLRQHTLWPLLRKSAQPMVTSHRFGAAPAFRIEWDWPEDVSIALIANLDSKPVTCQTQTGRVLCESNAGAVQSLTHGVIPPKTTVWFTTPSTRST